MVWRIVNKDVPVDKMKELVELCKTSPADLMLALSIKEESPNITFLYHIMNLVNVKDEFYNVVEKCSLYERSN